MPESELNTYLNCDVLRYRVSDAIEALTRVSSDYMEWWVANAELESVVDIASLFDAHLKSALSVEKVKEFLRNF